MVSVMSALALMALAVVVTAVAMAAVFAKREKDFKSTMIPSSPPPVVDEEDDEPPATPKPTAVPVPSSTPKGVACSTWSNAAPYAPAM